MHYLISHNRVEQTSTHHNWTHHDDVKFMLQCRVLITLPYEKGGILDFDGTDIGGASGSLIQGVIKVSVPGYGFLKIAMFSVNHYYIACIRDSREWGILVSDQHLGEFKPPQTLPKDIASKLAEQMKSWYFSSVISEAMLIEGYHLLEKISV